MPRMMPFFNGSAPPDNPVPAPRATTGTCSSWQILRMDYNLYYAPDPSSQIVCTIGGNVAENSGGVHCLKYGMTVHNVLQVTAVTIEGELITVGSLAADTQGLDLLGLLHGSEGMLAVTVEIVVKLLPKPNSTKLLMAAFDSVDTAGDTVAEIIANGIIPAGLEMMDKPAIIAAEAFAQCGYPTDAEALFLCELDGTEEEVQDQLQRVDALVQKNNASLVHIARDEEERMQLWKGRKSAFPAVGRLSPDYYCIDGTIPRRHLSRVLQQMNIWSDEYGLRIANVFHAGDGNLHPLILFDANIEGELEKTEELGGKILELCVEVGGTITGEHGVGMEKINQMCVQFSSNEITQFHAIKNAFDPSTLLNPSKTKPTMHTLSEYVICLFAEIGFFVLVQQRGLHGLKVREQSLVVKNAMRIKFMLESLLQCQQSFR